MYIASLLSGYKPNSSDILEKRQKGKRRWQGKAKEQQAVYENRRRVQGDYGKSLLRRRGELVERSFAHFPDFYRRIGQFMEMRKADYYRLVPHVPDNLVADEIRLALDRIAEVAGRANPARE